MTNEQAKSELMQIYMSLSEEKKKALDVAFKAMEQADNIPVMYYPQVDGITPTVVAQADGEKTCGTCRNEDTYHCAECENKSDYEQAQAYGEYISKENMGHWIWQTEDIYQCSECGEDLHVKEVMNKPQYICCPICGCPMEIER